MNAKRTVMSCVLSALLVFSLNPATALAADLQAGRPDGTAAAAAGEAAQAGAGGLAAQHDPIEADLSEVDFVYLESSELPCDQTQRIAVGLADETLVVEAAELDLVGPAEDRLLTLESVSVVEGAVLFEVAGDSLELGSHEVSALRFLSAGVVKQVSFSEDDRASYVFEVVEAAGEEAPAEVEVFTVGDDGQLVEAGSIAEALDKAGVEAARPERSSASRGLSTQMIGDVVIVLDPGHGGHDSGAVGNGVVEKDVNLRIARYCRERLEQYEGVTVYMTREDDTYVSLADRAELAKRVGATAVISLHNNSSSSSDGRGTEVIIPRSGSWYYEETYVMGLDLANEIMPRITALGLPYRSIYSRDCTTGDTYPDGTLEDYYALICRPREAGICGIIVEHAFVSNPTDAAFLASDENLRRLGYADADGIAAKFGLDGSKESLYWAVYDYGDYLAYNPNLKAAYEGDREGAFAHFKEIGRADGLRTSLMFDPVYYRNAYPDLDAAYGDDMKQYFRHFMRRGMAEGRLGSPDFNPYYYRAAYADLDEAFGDDLEYYYYHYVMNGRKEGRKAARSAGEGIALAGRSDLVGATTVYGGVDYSGAFDPVYYAQANPDVASYADRGGMVAGSLLIRHFVHNGMNEGRSSIGTFSLASYFNAYPDLRRAFGTDWPSYYRHYAGWGLREGRLATGTGSLVGIRTEAEGIDWSPVYDPDYYFQRNPDVVAAAVRSFATGSVIDDNFVIEHLMNRGMNEQRKTSAGFDFAGYRSRNPDLRRAFGADWKAYYRHYVQFGRAEGRDASPETAEELASERIMGASLTSPQQMANRYNDVGRRYPSEVYEQYGAGSIEQFCQIVYEEARIEGVRAEVVFAQAMHETGWLQFGGDVSADQCNFSGLGATGGVPGNSFNDNGAESVRMGIRAQVQHLKAYASTDQLVNPLVDVRFDYVVRGCAPLVYDLGGKWAVGASYGVTLMNQMDALLLS